MTVWLAVRCPDCLSTDIVKRGKTRQGKQRYQCRNSECVRCTFILEYTYQGRIKEKKEQMVEMSLTGERKTICYSRSEEMHDTVIGLFINRYEFGEAI
jgi:transposase-like protein